MGNFSLALLLIENNIDESETVSSSSWWPPPNQRKKANNKTNQKNRYSNEKNGSHVNKAIIEIAEAVSISFLLHIEKKSISSIEREKSVDWISKNEIGCETWLMSNSIWNENKIIFFHGRMKDQAKRAEDNPENEIVTEQ